MGHAPNILRNPRALAALQARMHSESLVGWRRLPSGKLERVDTVAGCLARGAVVIGRCTKVDGCRRRVDLDLHFLRKHGFGDMSLFDVAKQFTCGRMGGCKLDFDLPRYPDGLPLFELAGPPDHLLQFRCRRCGGEGYRTAASDLLARLVARGQDDAHRVGAAALARRLRRVCDQCRGELWVVVATEMTGVAHRAITDAVEGDAAEPDPGPGRRGFDFDALKR